MFLPKEQVKIRLIEGMGKYVSLSISIFLFVAFPELLKIYWKTI